MTCSSWFLYLLGSATQGSHQPIAEMPHGLTHSTVWWGHFLNSCSLFPNNSNLCGVDLRTSQRKDDSLRGNKWSEQSLYCHPFLCVDEFLRIKMFWMGSDDQHYGLPDYQHSRREFSPKDDLGSLYNSIPWGACKIDYRSGWVRIFQKRNKICIFHRHCREILMPFNSKKLNSHHLLQFILSQGAI